MTSSERGKDATDPHRPAVRDYLHPDPGQGGQTYGATIDDSQVRRWRVRAIAAIITGIALTILFDFKIGISAATLVVVADVVWRARTARATGGEQTRLTPAMRRTERQLRGFDQKGWRVLHSRSIPGTSNRIDHLIIGPTGVYVVDSETWDKRLPVRTLSHKQLFHGPFNMEERLDEARFEARNASRLIGAELGSEVRVQASLAIYGPSIPWKVLTVRRVDVYSGGHARAYLRRKPTILSDVEIDRIHRTAEQVLPTMY